MKILIEYVVIIIFIISFFHLFQTFAKLGYYFSVIESYNDEVYGYSINDDTINHFPKATFITLSKEEKIDLENNDRFGVKKIYETKVGGREWFLNMPDPTDDSLFDLGGASINKNLDGTWNVGTTDIKEGFNGKYHIVMEVGTNDLQEWLNVEITGYVEVVDMDDEDNIIQWYARGGKHSSDKPCEGTSLKSRIHVDGNSGWVKEIWHDGGYTNENATVKATDSIKGKWIGWKAIIYNINNNTGVAMESYMDEDNNNQWKKVNDFIDTGGWHSSNSDKIFNKIDCNRLKDYIITNSGPIVAFRSDGIEWNFKNFSVREIDPSIK